MSDKQFRAYLSRVEQGLVSVWEREIKQQINLVPQFRGTADSLPLVMKNECGFEPKYNPSRKEISLSQSDLIALSVYVQQVLLFYVLGLPEVNDPETVDGYINNQIIPFIRSRVEDCITAERPNSLSLDDFKRQSFFHDQSKFRRPYPQVLEDGKNRPSAMTLAHYISVSPLFFAMLHEAGHHHFHAKNTDKSPHQENEADDFAVAVFASGQIPVSYGIPFLQMFSSHRNQKEIACRIARLANADTKIALFMREFPRGYAERVENLRRYYQTKYGDACP